MEDRLRYGVSVALVTGRLPPLSLLGNILNSAEFAMVVVGSRVSVLRVIPTMSILPRPCAIHPTKTFIIAGGSKVCSATV